MLETLAARLEESNREPKRTALWVGGLTLFSLLVYTSTYALFQVRLDHNTLLLLILMHITVVGMLQLGILSIQPIRPAYTYWHQMAWLFVTGSLVFSATCLVLYGFDITSKLHAASTVAVHCFVPMALLLSTKYRTLGFTALPPLTPEETFALLNDINALIKAHHPETAYSLIAVQHNRGVFTKPHWMIQTPYRTGIPNLSKLRQTPGIDWNGSNERLWMMHAQNLEPQTGHERLAIMSAPFTAPLFTQTDPLLTLVDFKS